jgi:bile acid-coenzyme A ligase
MSALDYQLRDRAVNEPARPALVAFSSIDPVVWTWSELETVTATVAAALTAAVVRPQRTVLLVAAGNHRPALPELIGALRTELPVAAFAGRASQTEQLAYREALSRAGYDIVSLIDRVPVTAVNDRSARPLAPPLPPEAILLATGGSSGRPKLVVDRRMRTVVRRPRSTRPSSVMNWRSGQRQVVIGPLHHAAPLTYFIEGLCDGNTIIVPTVFDGPTVLAAIEDWRAEWFQLSPYHMRHLGLALQRGQHDLSHVLGMLHHAAPCPEKTKREWLDRLGPSRVFEMYGATEGIGVTVANGHEWLRRPGTVGRGFFTQIRILDSTGRPRSTGEVGDVFLRSGPPAQRVYLDGERVRTTFDGFATVGDRGWTDADRYLYLARRQLTRIQVGGETVDPAEVESALCGHPDVLDAAVLGVPDERLGESVIALVVAADGVEGDATALRRYVRERIARHKVPRLVQFVPQLPQTEAGKLDRSQLAALVGRQQEDA